MPSKTSRRRYSLPAGVFLVVQILFAIGSSSTLAQVYQPYIHREYGPDYSPFTTSWFIRMEYLALWAKGNNLPPLLTTSPNGTPVTDAGVLGEPGTEVLFGGRLEDRGRQGARLTLGHWLDYDQTVSWEIQWWFVDTANEQTPFGTSSGDPIVARPFFDTETNDQNAQIIAAPGLTGSFRADTDSEVSSANALLRYKWWDGPYGYVDLFGGYRFFTFQESLTIDTNIANIADVRDQFATDNDFHGVDLGTTVGLGCGPWLLDITTKVALGDMREQLLIFGASRLNNVIFEGGFLASPTNIGTYTDHTFVAIPELDLRLSYTAFDRVRLSLGYDLIFVSKVLRTGDQIDLTVNPGELPLALPLARGGGAPSNAQRPEPRMDDTAIWLQGISFGVELRW